MVVRAYPHNKMTPKWLVCYHFYMGLLSLLVCLVFVREFLFPSCGEDSNRVYKGSFGMMLDVYRAQRIQTAPPNTEQNMKPGNGNPWMRRSSNMDVAAKRGNNKPWFYSHKG